MKEFNEEELADIAYDMYDGVEVIDTIEHEQGRWHQYMTTIFRYEGKLYGLDWNRGLTECQDNEFFEQPYEVEPVKKVIEVIDYIPKKNTD